MLNDFYFPSSGKMLLNFSNDYLFHMILQENKIVRTSLAFTLLGIKSTVGTCVQLQNSIMLGNDYTAKHFPSDLIVLLSDGKIINLETEIYFDTQLQEYCFAYLRRPFEPLPDNRAYFNILPSLIDCRNKKYTSTGEKVFHETFMLMNDHQKIFSENFSYSILRLNQIHLAEQSDIDSGLVQWMKFLKATTWEEVNSLAANNANIEHAADSIYVYYKNNPVYYACLKRKETLKKIYSSNNII